MEFNFKSYDNSRQSISYCEIDKCKKVIELREQLQRKEQECERYAKINEQETKDYADLLKQLDQLKQTLVEIKEIACRLPISVTRQEILQKISEVIPNEKS